jgi:cell wall-associated NlpC family hydrolase
MSDARTGRPRLHYVLAAALLAAAAAAAVLLSGAGGGRAAALRGSHSERLVAEAPDPLARESYAEPKASVHHAAASTPRVASRRVRESFLSPGAPSDQQILSELHQEQQIQQSESKKIPLVTVDAANGKAVAPPDLPIQVQEVIAGGNAIRDFPYVYGGGHRSFVDDAYDCSGSVSYALAAAGLIGAPETSGQLEKWGKPGVGRYITVFADDGHTFMWVDGAWFDTAGRAGPYSTRWLTARPLLAGYVRRHPAGL